MGFWGTVAPMIGGSIIDEVLGQKEANKNRNQQDQMNQANADLQREFAQHGIRWRVEDAASVGLSPLAALGAASPSASPSFQMFPQQRDPDRFGRMGQDLSRAYEATRSDSERATQKILGALAVERAQLENNMLRLDYERRAQVGPGFPADGNSQIGGLSGQGEARLPVQIMPLGRTASPKARPFQAYGSVTQMTYQRHPDGSLEPMSSPDIQGDKANDVISMLKHHISMFSSKYGNPNAMRPSYEDHPLPRDMYWKFNYFTGRYHPTKLPKGKEGYQKWFK